ncbi:MAG: hypothetical protein WA971_12500 [Microbacterium sp.]
MNVDPRTRILHTDEELRDLLALLLQRASARQVWMLFIDAQGRLGDPVIPMADHPSDPLETVTVDDLGEVALSHLMVRRIAMLLEATGHASAVLVWERLGSERITGNDRAWARAMVEQAHDLGLPLRAQFVLHREGIRQLHPDDYL